jgi:hypothetical protein
MRDRNLHLLLGFRGFSEEGAPVDTAGEDRRNAVPHVTSVTTYADSFWTGRRSDRSVRSSVRMVRAFGSFGSTSFGSLGAFRPFGSFDMCASVRDGCSHHTTARPNYSRNRTTENDPNGPNDVERSERSERLERSERFRNPGPDLRATDSGAGAGTSGDPAIFPKGKGSFRSFGGGTALAIDSDVCAPPRGSWNRAPATSQR